VVLVRPHWLDHVGGLLEFVLLMDRHSRLLGFVLISRGILSGQGADRTVHLSHLGVDILPVIGRHLHATVVVIQSRVRKLKSLLGNS
jgi:hypothetical protein